MRIGKQKKINMMLFVVFLLVFLLAFVYRRCVLRVLPDIAVVDTRWRAWVFGDVALLAEHLGDLNEWFLQLHEDFGSKPFQLVLPGTTVLSIAPCAEVAKHILKDKVDGVYAKDPYQTSMYRELLGHGIFASDGERWRRQRRVAVSMLSKRALSSTMAATFNAHARHLVRDLLGHHGAVVDLQQHIFRCTGNAFFEVAFGRNIVGVLPRALQAFDRLSQHLFERYTRPLWRLDRLLRWSRAERTIARDAATLNLVAYSVVRYERSNGGDASTSILRRYLRADPSMSDTELRDVVLNFVLAGRDTTAALVTWTLYRLMRHADVREACVREARDVRGDPGYDDRLPYLHAVLLEVLRLHPPIPNDVKYATADDVLPDGTAVPKGTAVAYRPYVFGRHSRLWDRALEFDPSRWLHGLRTLPLQYRFLAFNAGPRRCVGEQMALLEAKILLVHVLRSLALGPASVTSVAGVEAVREPAWKPGAVLLMRDGLPYRVQAATSEYIDMQN